MARNIYRHESHDQEHLFPLQRSCGFIRRPDAKLGGVGAPLGDFEGESWSHDEKLFPPSPAFPGSRCCGFRLPPLRHPSPARPATSEGEKLVMIGDSITDVGRARPIGEGRADDALGRGHVMMVDALLGAVYPERLIRVINMGVSGNTTRDLKARWQKDVPDLKPDCLSIMIGANDVWRQYDSPKQTEGHVLIDGYERNLSELVSSTSAGQGPGTDDAVIHRAEPAGRDARDDGQVRRGCEEGCRCDSR